MGEGSAGLSGLEVGDELVTELFRASPSVVLITSIIDGRILEVSRSFERASGFTRDEVVGTAYPEPRFWADGTARQRMLEELSERGIAEGIETEFVAKSGASRRAVVSASRITFRGRPSIFWNAIDVTEQRRASEALLESQQRYRAVVENAFDMICELDERGHFLFVNPGFASVLGYQPEELFGRPAWEMLRPADAADVASQFPLPGGTPIPDRRTLRVPHRDGSDRWIEVAGVPLRSARGMRVVAIARDITESVRVEHERRERQAELERRVALRTSQLEAANRELREFQARLLVAERLSATEELAGSVAHAINNPLAALIGTLEMQLEAPLRDERGLVRSLELAKRIRTVVQRTLELFRRGLIEPTVEHPGDLLADVEEQVRARARTQAVVIETKIERDLPPVSVDRALVTTALGCVVDNALDAMDQSGILFLEAAVVGGLDVVAFRISDTGHGVALEIRPRVFEPFFTTKGGGTGLGMSIARGVVEGHGGRIEIGDRPGGGAAVSVELPAQRP